MAGGRSQESEARSQGLEDRRQKVGVGKQEPEGRRQKSEV